jgi:hypothetical protein
VVLRQINDMQNTFCVLEKNSAFGDFNCIYNRKAGFYYTAVGTSEDPNISSTHVKKEEKIKNRDLLSFNGLLQVMCVHRATFQACCELWPRSS